MYLLLSIRSSLRFSLSLSSEILLLSRLPHDTSSRTSHPGSMPLQFPHIQVSVALKFPSSISDSVVILLQF